VNPAAIGSLAAVAALGAASVALPHVARRRLARLCARRRTLVLTYDDGPGADATPRIVDLLAYRGVRATFFALGRHAERNPEILDRAARDGHEIGCHSYSHVNAWFSTPWDSVRDVRRGFRALAPWVGAGGLFRPPHGKLTPWTWAVARAAGARSAWWTIDSGDTWATLPPEESVVDRVRRRGGGVVLMHDFDRSSERVRFVCELTDSLVRTAREERLRITTLGALLREAPSRSGSGPRAAKEILPCR